ncbi:hypothetical protein Igni_1051 [Ignicoccus hospitalis KIN4/I]|uniref:Uncharacterized protein n=1 Tax=Ignicoccus hospitalis (strain KIN4/I / DSM 18386 / JCM 14125) TaxID=453591 RepID=A8ABC7_IGNH4|nr:hypothetical protein Igni_1051 [Ignicoccus hospitalis KIN4/I]
MGRGELGEALRRGGGLARGALDPIALASLLLVALILFFGSRALVEGERPRAFGPNATYVRACVNSTVGVRFELPSPASVSAMGDGDGLALSYPSYAEESFVLKIRALERGNYTVTVTLTDLRTLSTKRFELRVEAVKCPSS